jgi:hypothetical protein
MQGLKKREKSFGFLLTYSYLCTQYAQCWARITKSNMAKRNEIIVKDVSIKTMNVNGIDYICITDIAKQKNTVDPNGVIGNWMRNRNTIEFLGIWETLHNPNFNPIEFEGFRKEAGLNAFTLSPKRWIEATNAIGVNSWGQTS